MLARILTCSTPSVLRSIDINAIIFKKFLRFIIRQTNHHPFYSHICNLMYSESCSTVASIRPVRLYIVRKSTSLSPYLLLLLEIYFISLLLLSIQSVLVKNDLFSISKAPASSICYCAFSAVSSAFFCGITRCSRTVSVSYMSFW